jgi:hypothetical protein
MDLLPILNPFRALTDPDRLRALLGARVGRSTDTKPAQAARTIRQDAQMFIQAAAQHLGVEINSTKLANTMVRRLEMLLALPEISKRHDLPEARSLKAALKSLSSLPLEADADWLGLVTWIFLAPLGDILKAGGSSRDLASLLDELRLSQELLNCFQQYGFQPESAIVTRRLVIGLLSRPVQDNQTLPRVMKNVFEDPNLSACLQVNSYQGILWFNREAFQRVASWLMVTSVLDAITAVSSEPALVERILAIHAVLKVIKKAENQSAYQVNLFFEGLKRSKLIFS